jgi:hypothetical protein
MKPVALAALAAVALASVVVPERAFAQGFIQRPPQLTPYRRPAFSPYLNLLRGGSPTINYFGQVLPQINQGRQLQGQQLQLLQLQQQQLLQGGAALGAPVDEMGLGGLPTTGHPVAFWNYGRYYPGFTNRLPGSIGPGSATTPLLTAPLQTTPLATPGVGVIQR